MLKIGFDVHARNSELCALKSDGKLKERITVRGHPRRVLERRRRIEEPFEIPSPSCHPSHSRPPRCVCFVFSRFPRYRRAASVGTIGAARGSEPSRPAPPVSSGSTRTP